MIDNIRNNSEIREINQQIVLSYLRKNKISSRTDICNETQLSKSTMTRVIKSLIEDGLVREIGASDVEVGRKPIQVELITSSRYCVGINLSKNHVYGVIVDLNMEVVKEVTYSLKHIENGYEFLDLLIKIIKELTISIEEYKIIGVGIGVPGLVDYENGFIWRLDIKKPISDIAIRQFIEENTGYTTVVDNNANTRVLAEYWYGYAYEQSAKNLISIICNEGVGAGIICEGNLLRGIRNITGEIGEFIIALDETGYKRLEDYCSIDRLEEVTSMQYKEVCNLALEGNMECLNLLNDAAKALSIGLFNIILTLNPELVILSGKLLEAYPPLFNLVIEKVHSYIRTDIAKPKFEFRKVEDSVFALGATSLVFKNFFRN